MQQESRVKKSLLNARVNLIFYFLTLVLSFFSRKIFLDCLGADFIGLTGTLGNLLGFLNLAELGVGTAVSVVLYKPLFDRNELEINEIVSVLGYLYRIIGGIIFVAGLILACFLPLIFSNTTFDYDIIYFAYISFLISSLIGYYINYKQTLLSADQRSYVVAVYSQSANIVKTLLQMGIAYQTGSFYLWVLIEFLFGILYSIILNWKIKQVYPWLNCNVHMGRLLNKKYPTVMKYTRQIFIHRISGFIYWQITPILIYYFTSLQLVAYYGNYTMVTQRLSGLLSNFLGSTSAGVGSLIAEGDKENILKVYWELVSIRFWFTMTATFSAYYVLPPFIELWLGKEYVMSDIILVLVLATFAMSILRGTTDEFTNGFGLFGDIWAPVVESIISVVVSIICGSWWELEGVLMGSVVSTILIVFCWKPYFLFTTGFKMSVWIYWFEFSKFLFASLCAALLSGFVFKIFDLNLMISDNWIHWMWYGVYVGLVFAIIYYFLLLIITKGMKSFTMRVVNKLSH